MVSVIKLMDVGAFVCLCIYVCQGGGCLCVCVFVVWCVLLGKIQGHVNGQTVGTCSYHFLQGVKYV